MPMLHRFGAQGPDDGHVLPERNDGPEQLLGDPSWNGLFLEFNQETLSIIVLLFDLRMDILRILLVQWAAEPLLLEILPVECRCPKFRVRLEGLIHFFKLRRLAYLNQT